MDGENENHQDLVEQPMFPLVAEMPRQRGVKGNDRHHQHLKSGDKEEMRRNPNNHRWAVSGAALASGDKDLYIP